MPDSNRRSSALPRLLGADHGDDPAELGALGGVLLDDGLVDVLALAQVGGRLEHAVLQRQHLLQRVVEEGRGEGDGLPVAAVGQAHLQLARCLLAVLHAVGFGLLRLGFLAGGRGC